MSITRFNFWARKALQSGFLSSAENVQITVEADHIHGGHFSALIKFPEFSSGL